MANVFPSAATASALPHPANTLSGARCRAIHEGRLIELSSWRAATEQWPLPLCCTEGVFAAIKAAMLHSGQEFEEIIRGISATAKRHLTAASHGAIRFTGTIGHETKQLLLVCGPGDDPRLVLTLLLADELAVYADLLNPAPSEERGERDEHH